MSEPLTITWTHTPGTAPPADPWHARALAVLRDAWPQADLSEWGEEHLLRSIAGALRRADADGRDALADEVGRLRGELLGIAWMPCAVGGEARTCLEYPEMVVAVCPSCRAQRALDEGGPVETKGAA